MTNSAETNPTALIFDGHSLEYHGYRFDLGAKSLQGGYRPTVVLVRGPAVEAEDRLPNDTEEVVYSTEAEAVRHAEQQAVRWVHDRTGDGQGQF